MDKVFLAGVEGEKAFTCCAELVLDMRLPTLSPAAYGDDLDRRE